MAWSRGTARDRLRGMFALDVHLCFQVFVAVIETTECQEQQVEEIAHKHDKDLKAGEKFIALPKTTPEEKAINFVPYLYKSSQGWQANIIIGTQTLYFVQLKRGEQPGDIDAEESIKKIIEQYLGDIRKEFPEAVYDETNHTIVGAGDMSFEFKCLLRPFDPAIGMGSDRLNPIVIDEKCSIKPATECFDIEQMVRFDRTQWLDPLPSPQSL